MNKDVIGVQEVSPGYEFVAENPAVPVGYKQTEVGVIPDDWDSVPIGSLFEFKNGLNKEKKYFGHGTPIVNYMDVFKHSGLACKDIQGRVALSKQEIDRFDVREGDVFFTRTSETVDEIGTSAVMLESPEHTVFSGFILRARPSNSSLSNGYKKYCFSAAAVRTQIVATATYTTRALTNGRALSDVFIPLPPKPEQRAIATALGDVDALLDQLDRLITKKRDIKQAAMQQLLTGETRLPGFEGEWSKMRMGNFGHTYGGLVGKSKGDFGVGTALYVPFTSVMESTVINCQKLEKVSVAVSESQNQVIAGDILFNGSSETPEEVAMCALMEEEVTGLYLNSFCFGFRLKETAEVDPQFLVYFMRSSIGREVVKSLAQGSTRYNLSKTALLNAELNLPKLQEQEAIAAVLSDMDTEIHALEQRRSKTAELKQGMMQELLTGRTRLV